MSYNYDDKTISSQIASLSQVNLSNAKLSYQNVLCIKNDTALKLNIHSILTPYTYRLKQNCSTVAFNEDQARLYMYKPKSLAYDAYGNVELYYLILKLNHMKSISDFTMERLTQGIIIPTGSITNFLNEVLIKEKNPLARNSETVQNDVNTVLAST